MTVQTGGGGIQKGCGVQFFKITTKARPLRSLCGGRARLWFGLGLKVGAGVSLKNRPGLSEGCEKGKNEGKIHLYHNFFKLLHILLCV
jgi:hypothetical protein